MRELNEVREMQRFCCDRMERSVTETQTVIYNDVFDEYGIPCREDSGESMILMDYCPWCGAKLPESKRADWFDELEKLGFDAPITDDGIPDEYKSAKWRKE